MTDIVIPASEEIALDHSLAKYLANFLPKGAKSQSIMARDELDIFTAIMDEVEKTILPRRIIFQSNFNNIFSLFVTDRHVVQVIETSGPWAAQMQNTSEKPHDPATTDLTIDRVYWLLTKFAAAAEGLSITHQQLAAFPTGGTGISGRSLQIYHPKQRLSLIQRFMDRLGQLPKASLWTDGTGPDQRYGDTTLLQSLQQTLRPEIDPGFESEDQLIILSTTSQLIENGLSSTIAIAHSGTEQFLCHINSKDLILIAELWIAAKP